MRAVIQRVSKADIVIDGNKGGNIGVGLVVLLGVMEGDTQSEADLLCDKMCGLRIFRDENDKMNLSLEDVGGSLLIVSNFTLGADSRKGRRPSFEHSARPEIAEPLYDYFVRKARTLCSAGVETGSFGADMEISMINQGPVTIILDTDELVKSRRG